MASWQHYCSPQRYRHPGFAYRPIVNAVGLLLDSNLIDEERAPSDGPSGYQSIMRARDALVRLVSRNDIHPRKASEPIELRGRDKTPIEYRDNRMTNRARRILEAINDATSGLKLTSDLGDLRQPFMRRIFNGDFKNGGRFYASGASWQNMPKATRATIRIDGDPTGELDFSQLHPTVLYAERGLRCEGDAYTLAKFPRDLGKIALNTMLNADCRNAALGAISEKIRHEYPAFRDPRDAARNLVDEMERRHRPIASAFNSSAGLRLMKADSDVAEQVQISMAKRGSPVLGLHDGFIAKKRDLEALKSEMSVASKAVFGVEIEGVEKCR